MKKLFFIKNVCYFIALFLLFSVKLISQDCNQTVFDFTFDGQEVSGQVFTNKSIRITDTVTFTTNVYFNGCNVLMDKNAVIKLKPNILFSASVANGVGTTFYGCNRKWSAIEIGNKNRVQLNRCTIQNSKDGIRLLSGYSGGFSYVNNCLFRRNDTGITASSVPNLFFSSFVGNTFNGDIANSPQPQNQIKGISISRCVGTIGTAGGLNTFVELSTGISIENNSNISVNNCSFTGIILPTSSINGVPQGVAIESKSSSLSIQGSFSGGVSCSFASNIKDIVSERTKNINISNAVFKNSRVFSIGVIESNVPNNIVIEKSLFEFTTDQPLSINSVINVSRAVNSGDNHLTVEKNTIHIYPAGSPAQSAITALMSFTSASPEGILDYAEIKDNVLLCEHGNPPNNGNSQTMHGMKFVGKADNYKIQDNEFNYDTPTDVPNSAITTQGITMQDNIGAGNKIVSNTMIARYFPFSYSNPLRSSFLRCGLHIVNVPSVFVCQNDIKDATNNYHFLNNCSTIEFGENTVAGTGAYALIGENSTSLPVSHDHKRNRWLGTYVNGSAVFVGAPTGTLWRVDPSVDPSFFPPGMGMILPPSWFLPAVDTGGVRTCSSLNFLDVPPSNVKIVKQLMDGKYVFNNNNDRLDFEFTLLSHMIKYPSLFDGDFISNSYYQSRIVSNVWKLANATKMLESAMAIPISISSSIDNLVNDIAEAQKNILDIESVANFSTDSVAQQVKKTNLDNIFQKTEILDSINNAVIYIRSQNLTSLLDYINGINTENDWEWNNKFILKMRVKTCNGDTLSSNELERVRVIANLCDKEFGNAVRFSRSLLPSTELSNFVDDHDHEIGCESLRPRSEEHHEDMNRISINVFPNPAMDFLAVNFSGKMIKSVNVFDLNGKILRSLLVNDYSAKLDVSSFNSGIYILSISTEEGDLQRFFIKK
jgi:hypothetical protein